MERIISKDDFWNDREKAQTVLKEQAQLREEMDWWNKRKDEIDECQFYYELSENEGDEGEKDKITIRLMKLEKEIKEMELRRMFSGEKDENNAIVSIHPGAGGTEAQDWAEMLLRMYLRWAERMGFKTEIYDYQLGEEAGIKDATFLVEGKYAYGYLKAEVGVHRLVRISPFDANKKRHTSFASVFVYPEIEEDVKVEINEEDLRIDTFRASGAGGQHVNRTDSAVRIVHLSTGIVVQCQNERSQHKNKAIAMKILRARLYELKMRERVKEIEKLASSKKEIAWGNQIRSYILHPYRMVKDHRLNMEIGNAEAVLDGDIQPFIEVFLCRNTFS